MDLDLPLPEYMRGKRELDSAKLPPAKVGGGPKFPPPRRGGGGGGGGGGGSTAASSAAAPSSIVDERILALADLHWKPQQASERHWGSCNGQFWHQPWRLCRGITEQKGLQDWKCTRSHLPEGAEGSCRDGGMEGRPRLHRSPTGLLGQRREQGGPRHSGGVCADMEDDEAESTLQGGGSRHGRVLQTDHEAQTSDALSVGGCNSPGGHCQEGQGCGMTGEAGNSTKESEGEEGGADCGRHQRMRPSLQLPPNFGPLDDPEAEDPYWRLRASSFERPAPDPFAFAGLEDKFTYEPCEVGPWDEEPTHEPKNMPTVIRCAPGVLDDPEAEDPFTFAGLEE